MRVNKSGTSIGFAGINWRKFAPYLLLLFLALSGSLPFSACIEEYVPELKAYDEVLVVDGSIIKGDTLQKVTISISTEIYQPEFSPLLGCNVYATDQDGNEFIFKERGRLGVYSCEIPQSYMEFGSEFQLHITTPDGEAYLSGTETIRESSPIDSVYFVPEPYQTSATLYDEGLQFYADLKAPDSAVKKYLWKVEETWEMFTEYGIDGHWQITDISLPLYDPDGSLNHCWTMKSIRNNYTSSTENLVVNEKKRIPLNFVPNSSTKLDHRYSVLVKQYTLNDEAYLYHSQNNFATSGDEGLYQKQPAQSRSNLQNLADPDEVVLGYFWASSYTQKRLFFDGPLTYPQLDCDDLVLCIPKMGQSLMQFYQGLGRDVYLVAMAFSPITADSVSLFAFPRNQVCIDCTTNGGTTQKPDYW